ncbi:MAG: cyanophycinase [Chloroflexota bacterium]
MPQGTVIVIGGAEDKVRDRVILGRFIALAGGDGARIAVISTASSLGPEAGARYKEIFTDLGAAEVTPIHAVTRLQANDEHIAAAIRRSTGIFMTGGNQLRLSSMLGGTRVADAIAERFREGAVVAGTSAGASAVSSHMIAFGASGATPKHRMAQIAAASASCPASSWTSTSSSGTGWGGSLADRAEPVAAGPGRGRGHRGCRRAGPDHGGHRPGLDHRGRRRRVRHRRLGGPRARAPHDQRRGAAQLPCGLSL